MEYLRAVRDIRNGRRKLKRAQRDAKVLDIIFKDFERGNMALSFSETGTIRNITESSSDHMVSRNKMASW